MTGMPNLLKSKPLLGFAFASMKRFQLTRVFNNVVGVNVYTSSMLAPRFARVRKLPDAMLKNRLPRFSTRSFQWMVPKILWLSLMV